MSRGIRTCLPFLLAVGILLPAAPSMAANSIEETGMELSTPVRHQLHLLHDAWQSWTRAYYRVDQQAAAMATERLLAISRHLGMSRLPDLSVAAAAFAVLAAQEGDPERARWVLETARQLDGKRPEIAFASAAIRRHEGDWLGAVRGSVEGYLQLLEFPLEREIWLQNVGLWLLLVMVLSGGVFVALMFLTRGQALYHEILGLFSPRVLRPLADLLVVAALLWPLALPSGVLWLALYWSILLWGYGSLSEKVAFVVLWLVLGLTPLLLSLQQRSVQLALIPPTRAIENLSAGRLYGALFSDLGVLRALLRDEPAVLELVADLHRRFDQWDEARQLYNVLAQEVEQDPFFTAAPLSNLGLYHLRKKDYGTAVNYFQRSTAVDPDSPEAYFNLAQGYSHLFEFARSNDALEEAKLIDRDRVEAWESRDAEAEDSGVGIDGGVRRASEIQQRLSAAWRASDRPEGVIDLWRRHLSLSIAIATILLAVTLHLVRQQLGTPPDEEQRPVANRWLRALVPGWKSVGLGRGGRALLGIALPVGFATLPLVRGFGYRSPLGVDPGSWLPAVASIGALGLLLLIRLGWEMTGDR